MSTESSPASQGIRWLLVALVCLAAGVLPGWIDVVPEPVEPWAFVAVGAIAVGATVMSLRGRGPTWIKVATSISAGIAVLIALIFAGLNFRM